MLSAMVGNDSDNKDPIHVFNEYNGYQAINQKPYDEMISAKEALHLVNSKMAKN